MPVPQAMADEGGHGMSELVELIMKVGFTHACAAGDGRRQEAMA